MKNYAYCKTTLSQLFNPSIKYMRTHLRKELLKPEVQKLGPNEYGYILLLSNKRISPFTPHLQHIVMIMDSSTSDNKMKEKYYEHRTIRPKLKYSLSYHPSMSRPLDFSVKGPVPIYIHKKQKVLTGCSYIELKLQKHSKVGEITFRNYYTANVSILLLRSNAQGPAMASRNWEVGIKNRILMKRPHCENGAQDYFSLFLTDAWINVTKLKIILRQPSPMCKTFHLEEIKLYADVPRFGRPFFEQKLPSYLIHNTTGAISWKPSPKINEMPLYYRSDVNKTQGYVVEQVPSNYENSKI